MLSGELKKLKDYLENKTDGVDKKALLEELRKLDKNDMQPLCESLSMSSKKCPTCGRDL